MLTNQVKKEIKAHVTLASNVENALENGFEVYKTIRLYYDENKGWSKEIIKADTTGFDSYAYMDDQIDLTGFSHAIHAETGKKYELNQNSRISRYARDLESAKWEKEFDLELETNRNTQEKI